MNHLSKGESKPKRWVVRKKDHIKRRGKTIKGGGPILTFKFLNERRGGKS